MTREVANPVDGVNRVFTGSKKGNVAVIYQSPLIPKVGKSTKKTITGRN